jgi:hypothetical protein
LPQTKEFSRDADTDSEPVESDVPQPDSRRFSYTNVSHKPGAVHSRQFPQQSHKLSHYKS